MWDKSLRDTICMIWKGNYYCPSFVQMAWINSVWFSIITIDRSHPLWYKTKCWFIKYMNLAGLGGLVMCWMFGVQNNMTPLASGPGHWLWQLSIVFVQFSCSRQNWREVEIQTKQQTDEWCVCGNSLTEIVTAFKILNLMNFCCRSKWTEEKS